MILLASHRPQRPGRILATNLALITFLVLLLLSAAQQGQEGAGLRFLRLWTPVIFFWWAYTWAGHTLGSFYPSDYSLDPLLIRLEQRWLGQPSLWWARHGSPWLTELFHGFYVSYYLYTPVLGIALYAQGRFREFEAMAFAVMFGYAVGYSLSALIPVWGPRWGLVAAGLLESSEQKMRGYGITRAVNSIMYGGVAHKGAAMPSTHSSTAVVFLVWCSRLWGVEGGVLAGILVVGMGVGSVYGRYHYVADILCGAALGVLSVWIADRVVL
jgi:membrane-associated phospholipid phosphatase